MKRKGVKGSGRPRARSPGSFRRADELRVHCGTTTREGFLLCACRSSRIEPPKHSHTQTQCITSTERPPATETVQFVYLSSRLIYCFLPACLLLPFLRASHGGVLCSMRGAADLGRLRALQSPGCLLRVHRANACCHGGFALLHLQAGLPQCLCHQGASPPPGSLQLGFLRFP